tara:strand:- start:377 stop:970 length:594 start_codon:yes stop_codon:yes gene_type:complete
MPVDDRVGGPVTGYGSEGKARAMDHKAILLATDLSARCDRPLDRALMLAKEWNTKLILLHILDPARAKDAATNIREIEAQIADELPRNKGDIEILVKTGDIAATIIETAQDKKCDLIVTGVARYNSIGDILLGGPVDQLIRNAPVPVLVVKRRPQKGLQEYPDCDRFLGMFAAGAERRRRIIFRPQASPGPRLSRTL